MNVYQYINEENMDTHDMKPSSQMVKVELIFVELNSSAVIISPSLTEIDQKGFPIFVELFIEPSCFENSCDFILSSDREYVLKDISDSHVL
jgi:hypothetical protein